MTKKEIRQAAKQMILAGSSRQAAFEAVKQQANEPAEKVANLVRYIPTLQARAKYRTPWMVLIALMVLGVLGKLFMAAQMMVESGAAWWPALLLMPLINVVLTIGVVQYRGETFRIIAILTVLSLLRGISSSAAGGFDIAFLIDALMAAALIYLSLHLNTRLVSEAKEVKQRYTNEHGQDRLRNTLVFQER